jgi:hypothetical protein
VREHTGRSVHVNMIKTKVLIRGHLWHRYSITVNFLNVPEIMLDNYTFTFIIIILCE